ncbi:AIG1-like protein [Tanacetum coccineum]
MSSTIKARLDDQAALVAGTLARLEANKVLNDGDGGVKVLNWVQQAINVESTSDNDARDQASELEAKVLVDGKQDEAKVVKVIGVTDEQNSNEPNLLEGNRGKRPNEPHTVGFISAIATGDNAKLMHKGWSSYEFCYLNKLHQIHVEDEKGYSEIFMRLAWLCVSELRFTPCFVGDDIGIMNPRFRAFPNHVNFIEMLDADVTYSVIGEGCVIKNCKIHHSVVGLRSCIAEGIVTEDSLLMGEDSYELLSTCWLKPHYLYGSFSALLCFAGNIFAADEKGRLNEIGQAPNASRKSMQGNVTRRVVPNRLDTAVGNTDTYDYKIREHGKRLQKQSNGFYTMIDARAVQKIKNKLNVNSQRVKIKEKKAE